MGSGAPSFGDFGELDALAVEERARELIARSRCGEANVVLEAHIRAHPLRDRPRGLLIQALAGQGRHAEALRVYQEYRTYLAEQVGTEPSGEVRDIERRIARGDDDPATVGVFGSSTGPVAPARASDPISFPLAEAPCAWYIPSTAAPCTTLDAQPTASSERESTRQRRRSHHPGSQC